MRTTAQHPVRTSAKTRISPVNGENVVISPRAKRKSRAPAAHVEGIPQFLLRRRKSRLDGCLRASAGVGHRVFSPRAGSFCARTVGEEHGNVLLRQNARIACSDRSLSKTARYARGFILAKVYNRPLGLGCAPRVTTPSAYPWKPLKTAWPQQNGTVFCRSYAPAKTPRSCTA